MRITREIGGHEDIRDFYRLFMVPGMAHCSGDPARMHLVNRSTGRTPPMPLTISSRPSINGSKTSMRLIASSPRNT